MPKPPDLTHLGRPTSRPRRALKWWSTPSGTDASGTSSVPRKSLAEGASVKAVPSFPMVSSKQLIWIYDYKPKFDQTYYFSKPLSFPAGTKMKLPGRGSCPC